MWPETNARACVHAAATVNEAIQKCDVDVRRDMWAGIVLTGGGALLPGLRERLEQVRVYFGAARSSVVEQILGAGRSSAVGNAGA